MAKKLIFPIVVIGSILLILALCLGYYLYTNYYLPSRYTLPPPLENVEFPSEEAQYPDDWPDELKFPNDFVLVDSSSGTLPESTAQGWAAKLRYEGKPSNASKAISSFLEEQGWTIVENNKLDTGGFSLFIQREQGQGVIAIDNDPKNSSQTLIIVTVFP